MGRYCAQCGDWCSGSSFSRNQWLKGEGSSRCSDCVSGYPCDECGRTFNNKNERNMHMQVHRPRNVACPVCRDVRFRSGANAVQHVESGYCRGCRGKDNAREQIYRFVSNKPQMRRYLRDVPQLTYGDWNEDDDVPDFPYHCPDCAKIFRHLSQLLQHRDQKHNQPRLLGY